MADHSNITPSGEFLSEIPEYDAFISYKHGAVDSAAAKALQKNLEHFRAPLLSGIGLPGISSHDNADKPKKTGRIRRVFLDDGELSACAAFGSHIREALKKSRWLIIICSPETKRSPWVNLEIETFLEYHDRDHILAVMTSGEPADIFPDAFVGSGSMPDEMLAADARGETVREVLKKLRGDALLRIAAPILGLNYDDLKQRHRIYGLQRIAAAAIVCLAAVTCFSMYALSKNRQLEKSNADLWLRQAEITSKEAQDLLDQGDNLQAVQNLLSVLPDGSQKAAGERPDSILPSTQYLLTQALHLYKPALTPNFGEDRLAACAVINTDDYLDADLVLSPDGCHLLAMSGDNVIVWDSEACGQVCEIQFPERIENWSREAVLDNSRIVLCGGHTAACFDYTTGEQLWKTTVLNTVCAAVYAPGIGSDTGNSADSSSSDSSPKDIAPESRGRLFILTSTGVSVLSTEDGTLLSECKYFLNNDQNDSSNQISGNISADQKEQVSADQKEQVADTPGDSLQDRQTGEERESDEEFGQDNPPEAEFSPDSESSSESEKKSLIGTPLRAVLSSAGRFLIFSSQAEQNYVKYLFACDPETGETVQIDSEAFSEVYEIQSEISPGGKGEIIYYAGIPSETDLNPIYLLRAVTLSSAGRCKVKWSKEFLSSSVLAPGDNSYISTGGKESVRILPGFQPQGSAPFLFFCCYAHIFKLNPSDGNTLSDQELPSNMTCLLTSADHCFPFTSQGKIYACDGQSLVRITDAFPAYCYDIAKMTGNNIFFCMQDKKKIVKYAPMETDDRYTSLSLGAYDYSDPDGLLFNISRTDPLFHSPDWLVSADYNRVFWIRDNETAISSLSLEQIVKRARPEISDSSKQGEKDDLSGYLLSSYLKPLYLEGDALYFIDLAERKLSDTDIDYVYFKYILNLSDGSLTSETLFVSDENYPQKENIHFDQNSRTLYLLQPNEDYTRLWSYAMNGKGVSRYDLPLGNISFSSLSPDGRKVLLLSENDLKLYITDLDSKKTEACVSLSEYNSRSIKKLFGYDNHSMFCWNNNVLAVNDYLKIHIYDKSGTEIRTIPCGKSVPDPASFKYPLLSLSPDGKYLYYSVSDRLYQYDISEGKIINEIEPDPDPVSETGFGNDSWVCMFGGDDPEKRKIPGQADILHILKDNVLYTLQCDPDSFGVTSRIDNVFNYNPLTGKIYVCMYNSRKSKHYCLYYREYSLQDIIGFAEETYDIDDQETAVPDK